MDKLKERWGITSNWGIVAILIAFSINGSFAAWVSKPVTEFKKGNNAHVILENGDIVKVSSSKRELFSTDLI